MCSSYKYSSLPPFLSQSQQHCDSSSSFSSLPFVINIAIEIEIEIPLCMAVKLLSGYEVSDLCLGKPALRSLRLTDTVADALSALKRTAGDTHHLSVWNCHHSLTNNNKLQSDEDKQEDCICIGKVCMVDIICFLCKPLNLASPSAALCSPVSVLLPDHSAALLRHLQPNARLVGFRISLNCL